MATPAPVVSFSFDSFLSYATAIITIVGGLWAYFKLYLGIERRLVRLETKTELWWNTVADQIKNVLMQPVHFRKDDLIMRFPNITNAELKELKDIIITESSELLEKKDPKVAAYAIWRARVELECLERAGIFKRKGFFSCVSHFCGSCGEYILGKGK